MINKEKNCDMTTTLLAAPLIAIAALSLCSCAAPREMTGNVADAAAKPAAVLWVIEGQAAYRERIALPEDAVIIVRIDDVSLADAAAVTLAEKRILAGGRQVPIAFSLAVASDKLPGPGRNNLHVRIEDGQGKLLWITDSMHIIEPDGTGQLINMGMIMLVKV
jgi:putative lipoprotein